VTTMADVLVSRTWRQGFATTTLVDAALVLAGSLAVAVSAQLQYVLPFTPVPITGQTLAVLLVGATLGSRRGALAMAAYLAEGAAGLPVFAGGGMGLPWLLGPTAGYLWSLPVAAWLVGWLAERGWDRSFLGATAAMLIGNGVIYFLALPWLAAFVGPDRVAATGLFPFVLGDLIKIGVAATVLPAAWSVIGRATRWAGPEA